MKVTSKPIPPPVEDRPVVEITLELTKKEAAILRDLLMQGFDWSYTDSGGSSWSEFFRLTDSAADGTPGLLLKKECRGYHHHPFALDNGTPSAN